MAALAGAHRRARLIPPVARSPHRRSGRCQRCIAMGQTERLYKIKSQLDAGRCLAKGALLAELEISP